MLEIFLTTNFLITVLVLSYLHFGKGNINAKLTAALFGLNAWIAPFVLLRDLFPKELKIDMQSIFAPAAKTIEFISIQSNDNNIIEFSLINIFATLCLSGFLLLAYRTYRHNQWKNEFQNHSEARFEGTQQNIPVYSSPLIKTAVLMGFHKPTIWINPEYLNSANFDLIIKHELAHQKYGDNYWISLIEIISSIYWWNPFVLFLGMKCRFFLEARCDKATSKVFKKDFYRQGLAEILYTGLSENPKCLANKIFSVKVNVQRLKILQENQKMSLFSRLTFTLVLAVSVTFLIILSLSIDLLAGEGHGEFTEQEFNENWELIFSPDLMRSEEVIELTAASFVGLAKVTINPDGQLSDIDVIGEAPDGKGYGALLVNHLTALRYKPLHSDIKTGRLTMTMRFSTGLGDISIDQCRELMELVNKSGEENLKIPDNSACSGAAIDFLNGKNDSAGDINVAEGIMVYFNISKLRDINPKESSFSVWTEFSKNVVVQTDHEWRIEFEIKELQAGYFFDIKLFDFDGSKMIQVGSPKITVDPDKSGRVEWTSEHGRSYGIDIRARLINRPES